MRRVGQNDPELIKHRGKLLCTRGHTFRVGQINIYTVYTRYFWQGNHQVYGHVRCIYTVLANFTYFAYVRLVETVYKPRRIWLYIW